MQRPLIPADGQAEPTLPPGRAEGQVVVLLSMFSGLVLLALALAALSPLAPTAVDTEGVHRVLMIYEKNLKPEPLERFLFITGVLLLPFCLGGAYLGVRRFQRTPRGRRIIGRLAAPAVWMMTPLLLSLLFYAGLADDRAIVKNYVRSGTISLAAAVVLALGATAAAGGRFREQTSRLLRVLLPTLAGTLLLGILLFNIIGPEHIRDIPIYWASFNAVFSSVVQVFFGKELLVDFVNQYGLYPHFLEPAFSLVGLSVYTFTGLMGILNCLAFACLYRFIARETGDELLAFLGLATVLFFGYVAGPGAAQRDLYFQYHPLRTIFPALSLVVVRAFAHGPTPRLGARLLALGAAACLWNPDTGIIVLAAGFLLVGYDALLRRRPRELPARLLLGVAAATAVFASFSVFLRLRFGAFPDYARFFDYSQAFYLYGANMLPMPLFGIWVPVLLIYAAGLLLSLIALVEGRDTPRARLYFYLPVLGLGLFTYYQGRSTLGNLMAAIYPAVLLLVLFVDDLRRSAPSPSRGAERLLSVTLLALLMYSVPALATAAPDWARALAGKISVAGSGEENRVLNDSAFLRQYVRPGQEVVIVSGNSGVHHLLTQTTNPLPIPGDSELAFRKDYETQYHYVINRRGVFVIDKNIIDHNFTDVVQRIYPNFHENSNGDLIVFPAP